MKTVSDTRPWLMPEVIEWLERTLKPTDTVLETGAGGSTVFFAARVQQVITYEHTREWADKILARKLPNVLMCNWPDYPTAGLRLQDGDRFDFAFIDGRGRVRSCLDVLPHIKPGGWLVLDDSDRGRYTEAHDAANGHSSCRLDFSDDAGNFTTAWRIR